MQLLFALALIVNLKLFSRIFHRHERMRIEALSWPIAPSQRQELGIPEEQHARKPHPFLRQRNMTPVTRHAMFIEGDMDLASPQFTLAGTLLLCC